MAANTNGATPATNSTCPEVNIQSVETLQIADKMDVLHKKSRITTNTLSIQSVSESNIYMANTLNIVNSDSEYKLREDSTQYQKMEDPYQKFLGNYWSYFYSSMYVLQDLREIMHFTKFHIFPVTYVYLFLFQVL